MRLMASPSSICHHIPYVDVHVHHEDEAFVSNSVLICVLKLIHEVFLYLTLKITVCAVRISTMGYNDMTPLVHEHTKMFLH